eukprot:TRINITY_DN5427_c0_g1_i1.p1 TRINITY_DN5427_c0_g1~~TRINITY_DN5427_c0_g1_i1.p1  ORF type:complete len:438 (+),score=54.58 TRINITY_DN5427_c0_g1_i1:78-1391(+)
MNPSSLRTYPLRWYILIVACFFTFLQGAFWIGLSPVSVDSKDFFEIDTDIINLLLAWGAIAFLITAVPVMLLLTALDHPVRLLIVGSCFLCGLGMVIRCLALIDPKSSASLVFLNVGQVLNAAAGPVCMIIPPVLSAEWFAENERTKSTSAMIISNGFGVGIAYLVAPYVVHHLGMEMFCIGEAVLGVVLFLVALIYFPSHPKTPPTRTSEMGSEIPIKKELLMLIKNPSFILLTIIIGIQQGSLYGWAGMFDQFLYPTFSTITIGWIGFGNVCGGVIGSFAVGFLGDSFFKKKFKLLFLILLLSGTILAVFFTISFPSLLSESPLIELPGFAVIIMIILSGIFLFSASPLAVELAVEITYPVSEGTSASLLTWSMNLFNLLFLVITPKFQSSWINSFFLCSLLFCFILTLFVKEKYNRSNIDDAEHVNILKEYESI